MGMSAHQRIRRAMEEKKKAQARQSKLPGMAQIQDFEKMTSIELKEYAKVSGISIAGLTKKDDIKAQIIETTTAMGDVPLSDEKPENDVDPDVSGEQGADSNLAAGGKPDDDDGLPVAEGVGGNGSDSGTA